MNKYVLNHVAIVECLLRISCLRSEYGSSLHCISAYMLYLIVFLFELAYAFFSPFSAFNLLFSLGFQPPPPPSPSPPLFKSALPFRLLETQFCLFFNITLCLSSVMLLNNKALSCIENT